MKFLLDTCSFLWLTKGSKDLSPKAIDTFTDPKNEVYLVLELKLKTDTISGS